MAKYKISFDRELCIGVLACAGVAEKFYKTDLMKKVFLYMLDRPFKRRLINHKIDLTNEMTELQEAVKTYFQLETYLEEPQTEQFHLTRTQENL